MRLAAGTVGSRAALAAAWLLLTACAPTADEFRDADPGGFAACQALANAEGAGGSVSHRLLSEAATLGSTAATPSIREAVDDQRDGDPVIPDLGAFRDACEESGFDVG